MMANVIGFLWAAQMSAEDQAAIRQAISNARSMEEVERLQHMLRTGNIPSRSQPTKRRKSNSGTLVWGMWGCVLVIDSHFGFFD